MSHHPLLYGVQALLPSAREGAQYMIVAQPTRKELLSAPVAVPQDVKVTACPVRGPRQVRRKVRYGGFYHVFAHWPESHLDVARIPLLVCVTEGNANLHIADYVLQCRAGSFLIIPPGVPYGGIWRPHDDFGATESEDCETLTFCSWQGDAARVHCWTNRSREGRICTTGTYAGQIADPRVDRYFQALVDEATNSVGDSSGEPPTTEWRDACSGLWLAFLAALLREIKSDHVFDLKPEYSVESLARLDNKPISRAQEYVLRNLGQALTIDKVARAVYMSRARFTECFRKETGQSFNEYVTAQRLREARRMLRETNWPMHHVARAVGLSPSRMRGLFYEHEGVAPTAYRDARDTSPKRAPL